MPNQLFLLLPNYWFTKKRLLAPCFNCFFVSRQSALLKSCKLSSVFVSFYITIKQIVSQLCRVKTEKSSIEEILVSPDDKKLNTFA